MDEKHLSVSNIVNDKDIDTRGNFEQMVMDANVGSDLVMDDIVDQMENGNDDDDVYDKQITPMGSVLDDSNAENGLFSTGPAVPRGEMDL